MNILDEIVKKTKTRIEEAQKIHSLSELKQKAEAMNCNTNFPFYNALKSNDISFICEVKKASPSKGVIAEKFDYLDIAKQYQQAGADAISCLTEPYYFQGKNEYLKQITENVSIPVLRKDFTISEYMIYEAKLLGASAVLLICSVLEQNQLKQYLDLAHKLGLSALVEAHNADEIKQALKSGANIIGVNNRNLKSFDVDINNSRELRKLVPEHCIFVSESGIKTADDISKLKKIGVNAVLIGETLMRSENKSKTLQMLRGEIV